MAADRIVMTKGNNKSSSLSLNPSPPRKGERERRASARQGEGDKPLKTQRAQHLRKKMTEAEKKLWQRLRYDQLGVRFRRQHPIDDYIVDFFCHEKNLIIEVDGGQHNENGRDKKRTAKLEARGFKVLRFWNNEVLQNVEGVLETIQKTLKNQHSSHLNPSLPERDKEKSTAKVLAEDGGDIAVCRVDFPVLQTTIHGQNLAFLDSAASAQKPRAVIEAMNTVLENGYANIHRGLYQLSQKLTEDFEAVRGQVANFINAPSDQNIVFTRNATEAINLAAQSWGRTHLNAGDEVILTEMEHHANIVPWQILRDQTGIVIKTVPFDERGALDLEAFERLLTHKTKLVGVVHVSNALGTINPVKKIVQIARDFYPEMKVLIDGAQGAVHGPVDVQDSGADFYVFTGHKLYGPTGIGVLYGREDVLESMPPYQGGGDMIERVSFEKTTFRKAPYRFEAGTPAIVEVIGLGAAIDYVSAIGMDNIAAHEAALLEYGTEQLREIEGLELHGTAPEKAGILSFTMAGAHPSDIGMVLDQCGVAVRSGHHCCMPLMDRLGLDATVRASLGLYSNRDDIDQLVKGLHKVQELFR